VILVDSGPLVALFDPRDADHDDCRSRLKALRAPLMTTWPVLTEVFHILARDSRGAVQLRVFLGQGGVRVHQPDVAEFARALALMDQYADHPMDLADASLIAAAESLKTRQIFTLDRNDFSTYRIRRGHRTLAVEIV
jgi:predicted nucleic acid-binding protein